MCWKSDASFISHDMQGVSLEGVFVTGVFFKRATTSSLVVGFISFIAFVHFERVIQNFGSNRSFCTDVYSSMVPGILPSQLEILFYGPNFFRSTRSLLTQDGLATALLLCGFARKA